MTIPTIKLGPLGPGPAELERRAKKFSKEQMAKHWPTEKEVKQSLKAKEDKPKKGTKTKAKSKKAKRAKRAKSAPDLTQVPASMAPPPMEDSRPVPVPEPGKDAPSVAAEALGAEPRTDAAVKVQPVSAGKAASKPVTSAMTVDTRLVQGATCTWIGPLDAAPDSPDNGQPVCPHCKGHLLTSPDRATIELGLEQFELGAYEAINPPPRRHPGYKELVHWMMDQDQCWDTIENAAVAYREATGKTVDPSR
jgi:hypothetical protein